MKLRSIYLMALALLVLQAVHADELMKWERIPLQVPLKMGEERVIFADKNVRVGFPPALNGKLRVQSSGGAVYLKAESVFPQTRLQLQDMESGEIILLDVTVKEHGTSEPIRLIYSGDVTTISHSQQAKKQPTAADNTQTKRQPVKYNTPLSHYAAI